MWLWGRQVNRLYIQCVPGGYLQPGLRLLKTGHSHYIIIAGHSSNGDPIIFSDWPSLSIATVYMSVES